MQFWVCIEMHCTQIVWKLYKMWMIVFTQFRVRIGIHGCGKTTDVRCSDIQGKKFRCPILIPMFTCSVMLNYAGEAGDGRRQLTIISRLDKRLRLVIWMRMGVDNNRPPAAHLRLKMICNDFLVVKVNCWLYVFNIMKYVSILRNVKNKNIMEKTSESVHRWFVYFSQVMTSYQENTTKQPIECWMLTADRATTHRHDDKCRNRFLKHKWVK